VAGPHRARRDEGPATPFALTLRNGRALTLETFYGEPLVLALLACGCGVEQSGATLDRIRAELRGLGAALLLVSRDGVFCFRPDDDFELMVSSGDIPQAELSNVFAAHGLSIHSATGESALYIIDQEQRVRFEKRGGGADLADLANMLGDAARALCAAAPSCEISRRDLLISSLVATFTLALLHGCAKTQAPAAASAPLAPGAAREVDVQLDVNGTVHGVRLEPRVTLLDALREKLGLTGTKKGCDQGQCGACTVLVDGRRINACLTLAVMVDAKKIITIEGLAVGDSLHPMQQAFVREDGFQCGFCTPGQIMSAVGLLREKRGTSPAEIREQMSGNICRCGAYSNIVAAIQRAAGGT
jgi:xanthine dehydrogenase YagT iron-sulfur-binding subunit